MPILTDDYPANASTSATLAIGASAKGMFEDAPDVDWFAVSLVAGTRYLFTLTPAGTSGYFSGFGLAVLGADGRPMVAQVTGDYSAAPATSFEPTVSGTYYLAASETSYGVLAYTLTAAVRTGSDDFAASTATRGVIPVGGSVSATFEVAGDHDWFKFHADVGVMYQFAAQQPQGSDWGSATLPSSQVIRDASGALVQATGYRFEAAVSGDYYLDTLGLHAGTYTMVSTTAPDDYSADNNTRGKVAPGGKIAGAIEFDGDVDRIQVTLEAGKVYAVSLTAALQDTNLDVDISDAGGTRLNYGGGFAGPDGGPIIVLEPKTSGVYNIDISHSQNTLLRTVLPYALSVSVGVSDDIGGTPATAQPIAVGAVASGAIQGSDVDMFKVTLDAGTTYAFALPKDLGLMLTLTGPDGAVAATATDSAATYYTFTPSQAGTYYAAVKLPYGVALNLPYTLAVSAPADDAGADPAHARALAVGTRLGGVLEAGGGDRDWFAVALTAGTTYWFTLQGANASGSSDGQLRLLDGAGGVLAQTPSPNYHGVTDTLPFVPTSSGTYYLEASSTLRTSGAYAIGAALGVPDDFGATPASAGTLTPGATVAGKIELPTDVDMLRLPVVAGQVYGLELGPALSPTLPSFSLADGLGHAIAIAGTQGRYTFTAPLTGDVYATLSAPVFGGTPAYTVREVAYGADDYGDTAKTSGTLAMGTRVQAALSYPGDADWLRVTLEAGKSYVFQLLAANSGGGTLATPGAAVFAITDGDTNYHPFGTALPGSADARIAFTPASGGDYFLSVRSGAVSVMGSYTLAANQLSGDASAPVLVAQSHPAGGAPVALGATTITLGFSEPVTIDKTAIVVLDSAGHKMAASYSADAGGGFASVNDATVTIHLAGILKPGNYTISLPHAAVHDLAGNQYAGAQSITFSTVQPVAAGTGGNDLLAGDTGAAIDGGAGVDTVLYTFDPYTYTVKHTGAVLVVHDEATGSTDTLANVERLQFGATTYAYDLDGNGGQAYRLYQAAFARTPDAAGLAYWMAQLDKGADLHAVASGFVASAEFTALVGAAPSDAAFLTALYANVLHRAPDAAGLDYWSGALHGGSTRSDVLVQFSESAENKVALVGAVGDHFTYTLY